MIIAELNAIVVGQEMDFKYKDCKNEMDMVNRAFIEVMIEGDANAVDSNTLSQLILSQ
jgi:ribonucleoside-triphosphate reductase